MRISQVCTYWRNIARDTAEIWLRISVDIYFKNPTSEPVVEAIRTHLALTKAYPLSLQMKLDYDCWLYSIGSPVLDLLIPLLPRCPALGLTIPPLPFAFSFNFERAFKAALPLLRSLFICLSHGCDPTDSELDDDVIRFVKHFFGATPNLGAFSLDVSRRSWGFSYQWEPLLDSIQHITSVNIQTDIYGARLALDCCSRLLTAIFDIASEIRAPVHSPDQEVSQPPLRLRNISLHFQKVDKTDLNWNLQLLLGDFTCPELASFILSSTKTRLKKSRGDLEPETPLVKFIIRCSEAGLRLQSFELSATPLMNLTPVVEQMPHLRHLVVVDPEPNDGKNAILTDLVSKQLVDSASLSRIRAIQFRVDRYWEYRVFEKVVKAIMRRITSSSAMISLVLCDERKRVNKERLVRYFDDARKLGLRSRLERSK
ncbi:hypothetical protein PM082_022020 [Marasmius tenuissimus]|nr:hypothetical protein PM082_022020 [Marasmius tenuissimus]